MKLTTIEHEGKRVLTSAQLAHSFESDVKIISNNYNRNKIRYVEGKHYYLLQGEELRKFKAIHQNDEQLKFATAVYLWTEKGAWLHAKSLNTDRAWEAYEMLVDDYYRVKSEAGLSIEALSPQLQLLINMEQKQLQLEARQQETEQKLETIKETFLQRDEDWRKRINGMIKGAAFNMGGAYQELRRQSYDMLEERAHCDLDRRLRNLVERLEAQGATKTQLKNTSRMDVIEAEPRLKEIYTTIVKELAIGTLA